MPCISKLVELYIRLIKCNLQTFKISRLWYVCESTASCLDVTFDVLKLTIKISKQGWRVISKSGAHITIPTILKHCFFADYNAVLCQFMYAKVLI